MEGRLNEEQERIVAEGDGALLVIAGPGSGKTRTLVHRVCHLLGKGAPASSILLLTFTNKAAREMVGRVEALAGASAAGMSAGTFHHFAARLLRAHGHHLGYSRGFSILDEQDSKSLLKSMVEEDYGKVKKGVVESMLRAISLSALKMQRLEELLMEEPELHALSRDIEGVLRVAAEYDEAKKGMDAMDFDDLLVNLHRLLSERSEIREGLRRRFDHIQVDECQDTDKLQAAIVEQLHGPGKGLMVVGDEAQSIYSFRGATIRNILDFKERYGARVLYLVRNYRSSGPIVSLINKSIERSRERLEKELVAVNPDGPIPRLIRAQDRGEEARLVADMVEDDLGNGKRVGVLFRASYQSSELELELTRKDLPYELRGGLRFFEQRHIKDMVCPLRVIANPKDRTSLSRLLTLLPGIGKIRASRAVKGVSTLQGVLDALSSLDKGGEYAALMRGLMDPGSAPAPLLDRFYRSFYRAYMDKEFDDRAERESDIDALMGAAVRFESIADFIETMTLDPDAQRKESDPSLVLSTIHQAKGLEWDSVYVIGLAEGMLPLARASDIEEERRLFYVAASRARTDLVMSYPILTGRFFDAMESSPSRFLMELPAELFSVHDSTSQGTR